MGIIINMDINNLNLSSSFLFSISSNSFLDGFLSNFNFNRSDVCGGMEIEIMNESDFWFLLEKVVV